MEREGSCFFNFYTLLPFALLARPLRFRVFVFNFIFRRSQLPLPFRTPATQAGGQRNVENIKLGSSSLFTKAKPAGFRIISDFEMVASKKTRQSGKI